MKEENINAELLDELFGETAQALIKLNYDALAQVISKTNEPFAIFCMLEAMNRLSAAMLSQTTDPEQSILQFTEEIRKKIIFLNQPTGTIQ